MKDKIFKQKNAIVFLQETETDFITLNFDLFANVSIIYMLSALNSLFEDLSSKFSAGNLRNELDSRHDQYLAGVEKFVRKNTHLDHLNENQKEVVLKASTSVIYLLSAIEINNSNVTNPKLSKGFTLDFKSEIPAGAGLGSSSSFAVCVAATFYIYSKLHSQPMYLEHLTKEAKPLEYKAFQETVSSWAFLSERIMHGTPSGLDNMICTFGNVLKFNRNPFKIEDVAVKSKINVMLVNTGVSRNTGEVVRNVRNLRETHTQLIDHIFDAMGSVVDDAVEVNYILKLICKFFF